MPLVPHFTFRTLTRLSFELRPQFELAPSPPISWCSHVRCDPVLFVTAAQTLARPTRGPNQDASDPPSPAQHTHGPSRALTPTRVQPPSVSESWACTAR